MIHFEGERTFPLPAAEVFSRLANAEFLVGCVKDVSEIVEKGPDRAVWKQRPGFSFVRTTLTITMDFIERVADTLIKVRLHSRGIGASSTVESAMSFHAVDGGTQVSWTADVTELTGLLKLVPKGLISSSANKVIEETWGEIEARLR